MQIWLGKLLHLSAFPESPIFNATQSLKGVASLTQIKSEKSAFEVELPHKVVHYNISVCDYLVT